MNVNFPHTSKSVAGGAVPLDMSDREFEQFRRMIYERAGISMSDNKKPLVGGRLARRVREVGLANYSEYFQLLMNDSAEMQVAVDLLTTNETYFFREPKHFDFLRETIAPELRKRPGPLRFWSGACSSGEEPYTLAMVLSESLDRSDWQIVASDLSTRVLARARSGHYPLDRAENIPMALLKRYCFKGVGDYEGTFLIDPALAARIRFMQVNLNDTLPPSLGLFDVIFLRNVMIYFDTNTKMQVMARLIKQLRPDGYFIISHSENLNGVTDALQAVKPSIYRKPLL